MSILLSPLAWGQDFATHFNQGVELYRKKNFAEAQKSFAAAHAANPQNAVTITNLALVEFQLKNKPLSIALFRKALQLNPKLPTAEAGLKYAISQMEVKEIPHQIETYESVRTNLLSPVPLVAYQVLTALLVFSSSWTLLSYWGRRKRALSEESAVPTFPFIGATLAVLMILSATLLGLKIHDLGIERGTIIFDRVSLQSAPGENQVALLDLYGGFEVVVNAHSGDWVQVTYPGALTGWINKGALFITSK